MKTSLSCFCFIMFAGFVNAQMPAKDPAFQSYFKLQAAFDTLHVEIDTDPAAIQQADTIPNRMFFNIIPARLLQEIDHMADSSESVVIARTYFPLNGQFTAYWVDIRLFWFQHHSLLIYDRFKNTFTKRITLAEWFGGEGSQTLTGSWIFDFNGDGKKDILRQEIQHSMIPDGDGEALESFEKSAELLLWRKKGFTKSPLKDRAAVIRRYPIRSMWD